MANQTFPWEQLNEAAQQCLAHSYSPYSKFRVAAALLSEDGKIFPGINVENRSYSLTTCAERSALSTAVTAGKQRFQAILILGETDTPLAPCGACRQLLAEFAPEMAIQMRGNHQPLTTSLDQLLPMGNAGLMDLGSQ